MKTYKHSSTMDAVAAIYALYLQGAEMAEQLRKARNDLSVVRFTEKYKEIKEQYNQAHMDVTILLSGLPAQYRLNVKEHKDRDLHIGNAEEDLKLLSMPVVLSADEVGTMIERNIDNGLFLRTAMQYARKHNLELPRETMEKAAEAEQVHDYEKHAKMLHQYLTGYMPRTDLLERPEALAADMNSWKMVEDSGLLSKLDAAF